jgi:Ca2+-binding EF-hand superfamily protein
MAATRGLTMAPAVPHLDPSTVVTNDNTTTNEIGLDSLTSNEVEDLRDAFQWLDTHNTGRVAVQELHALLEEMVNDEKGQKSTTASVCSRRRDNATATSLVGLYEKTASLLPTVSFLSEQDFIQLLATAEPIDLSTDEENDSAVFRMFSNGKDYIDLHDMQRIAEELGETSWSAVELQEMIAVAGGGANESNGKVTAAQFSKIINNKQLSL